MFLMIWDVISTIGGAFYFITTTTFIVLSIIAKYARVSRIKQWKLFRVTRYVVTWEFFSK